MRVLPIRADHERGGAPQSDQEAERPRHRPRHERQSLPLRHLCPYPCRHPRRRADAGGLSHGSAGLRMMRRKLTLAVGAALALGLGGAALPIEDAKGQQAPPPAAAATALRPASAFAAIADERTRAI